MDNRKLPSPVTREEEYLAAIVDRLAKIESLLTKPLEVALNMDALPLREPAQHAEGAPPPPVKYPNRFQKK